MNTVVLILAAGPAHRGWTKKNPKQLAIIAGKPLIVRTLDQLKERGYDDNVVVITKLKAIQAVVPRYFEPAINTWRMQTILSTQELWAERTIIIHGDTIFSPNAMDFIVAEQGPLMFISVGDQIHTEVLVFTAEVQDRVRAAAKESIDAANAGVDGRIPNRRSTRLDNIQWGGQCMYWTFYHALADLPPEEKIAVSFHPEIHRILSLDYTQDIDSLEKYRQFLARHKWAR